MSGREITTGRAFERLISFTDGVSAVAITLLALPLVSIGTPEPGESVWDLISSNAGTLTAFLITFVVVALMWNVHTRVFQQLRGFDSPIFWLNIGWLALLVMLPWATSMYGAANDEFVTETADFAGAGLFYWGVLAALSLSTAGMVWHAIRVPELCEKPADSAGLRRGLVYAGCFLILGAATALVPGVAMWLPFGLFLLPVVLRRTARGTDD